MPENTLSHFYYFSSSWALLLLLKFGQVSNVVLVSVSWLSDGEWCHMKDRNRDPLRHKLITSNYSSREKTNLDLSCSINNYTFHLIFNAWLGLISKMVWWKCSQKLRQAWWRIYPIVPLYFLKPSFNLYTLYIK